MENREIVEALSGVWYLATSESGITHSPIGEPTARLRFSPIAFHNKQTPPVPAAQQRRDRTSRVDRGTTRLNLQT